MYIVTDLDNDSTVGPFQSYEDANSFIAKVEEISHNHVINLEILEMTQPEEWLYENMDDLLMANC